ncbi:MAG: transketolase [Magnetococcales bacterium]|nr:transketolase [Magnetococcales bacterium]
MKNDTLDRLSVNTVRMLAADMVERAKSGHPGMPMGASPMAYVLWTRIMRHNPADPTWFNRDRFILSSGHASSMLYALLHLSGYGLTLEELKNFRQLGSRTPGHPEFGMTPGVETTTGLLGQGFANGVGMALAERSLAESFNHGEFLPLVDHYTYVICSDGDLMEGISSEASSLAGHLCLGKLIYLYDSNGVSIDGPTGQTFTEDVVAHFEACEWQVLKVDDGEDLDAIEAAIRLAQGDAERPSLIIVSTVIGHGTPLAGSPDVHGAPLGADALAKTRQHYDWPAEPFHVPEQVRNHFARLLQIGQEAQEEWEALVEAYRSRYPEEIKRFERQIGGILPDVWEKKLQELTFKGQVATRKASGDCINTLAPLLPCFHGGSADLGASVNTLVKGEKGRNIHFGVREHAMGAIVNGMALHGGWIPYCGTFLVFSDYMRPAVRMSALMRLHVIYVFSHDSVAVGEDGPTHQPVEHIASLRLIPKLTVLRPADARETVGAWRVIIKNKRPVALILSRQGLPVLEETQPDLIHRGAYVLADCDGTPEILLISTGGEVYLALKAQKELLKQGIAARVISMPSWELFAEQPDDYRNQVLPPTIVNRLAIEAGASFGWRRWVGPYGDMICIEQFGISAPCDKALVHFGFTVDNILQRARDLLQRNRGPFPIPAWL